VGLENLNTAQRQQRIQAQVDALYDPSNRRRGLAVSATSVLASVASASAPAGALAAKAQAVTAQAATSVAAKAQSVAAQAATAIAGAPHKAAAPAKGAPLPKGAPPPQAPPGQAALSIAGPLPTAPHREDPPPEGLTALQRLDWFIRIRVKKFQLGQSFTVLFFLGPVPEDVDQYRLSPQLIGSHSEFVNSDPEHCANCKDSANLITEGFVDLDDSLERLGLGHKTEEEIEKHIQANLHWRIQKVSRHHHRLHLTTEADGLLARSTERWCLLRNLRSSR